MTVGVLRSRMYLEYYKLSCWPGSNPDHIPIDTTVQSLCLLPSWISQQCLMDRWKVHVRSIKGIKVISRCIDSATKKSHNGWIPLLWIVSSNELFGDGILELLFSWFHYRSRALGDCKRRDILSAALVRGHFALQKRHMPQERQIHSPHGPRLR
jgi:hypothetical protein